MYSSTCPEVNPDRPLSILYNLYFFSTILSFYITNYNNKTFALITHTHTNTHKHTIHVINYIQTKPIFLSIRLTTLLQFSLLPFHPTRHSIQRYFYTNTHIHIYTNNIHVAHTHYFFRTFYNYYTFSIYYATCYFILYLFSFLFSL